MPDQLGGYCLSEIEELIKQIEELRSNMIKIIERKSFSDSEVITASKMLDAVLDTYHEMLMRMYSILDGPLYDVAEESDNERPWGGEIIW